MERGAIALSTTVLASGIIIIILIVLSLVGYVLLNSVYGSKSSQEALATAHSGIQDAIIKIIRSRSASGTYSVEVEAGKYANVLICNGYRINTLDYGSCSGSSIDNKFEIVSSSNISGKKRRIWSSLNINSVTGEINVEAIEEKSF